MIDDWGDLHGYTKHCASCGQLCDSTYCSTRCMLNDSEQVENESDDSDEKDPES